MKASLKVCQIDKEEVYRDFARVPQQHRGNIAEGSLCRISYCQRSVYLAVRGLQGETEAILRIDGYTRDKLGVSDKQTYEFEIEPLNPVSQMFVTWHASDPFTRQAMRLGVLGLSLGVIGLLLGLVSLLN